MWYIMEAEENAELIVGFNQELTQKSYQRKLDEGKILEVLKFGKVNSIPTTVKCGQRPTLIQTKLMKY